MNKSTDENLIDRVLSIVADGRGDPRGRIAALRPAPVGAADVARLLTLVGAMAASVADLQSRNRELRRRIATTEADARSIAGQAASLATAADWLHKATRDP